MDFQKKPLGTDTRSEPEPFMNEPVQQTPAAAPVEKKYPRKRSAVWRVLLTFLLIVTVGLLVTAWFYAQDLYAQLDRKDNEIAQLRNTITGNEAPAKDEEQTSKTTEELADELVTAYKKVGEGFTFTARVEKISSSFVLLYTKAEAPGAEPEYVVLKKSGQQLIEIDSYTTSMKTAQAETLKKQYGLDAKTLGIVVKD